MLRELWNERRIVLAVAITWLAVVVGVWVLAYVTTFKAHGATPKKPKAAVAAECIPVLPEHWEKLRQSGFEHEIITDPLVVFKIAAVLKANADKPIMMPNKIVIVFVGDVAKIGLLVNDRLCQILDGPSTSVRILLQKVHGQSVSSA